MAQQIHTGAPKKKGTRTAHQRMETRYHNSELSEITKLLYRFW
jgi:hypothetical protein